MRVTTAPMRDARVLAVLFLLGCGASSSETASTPPAAAAPPVAAAPAEPGPAEPTPPAAPPPLIAIDTHCDTPQRMLDEGDDISQRLPNGHLDLPRMREGGLTAAFMSIWVDPRRFSGEAAWERAQALTSNVRAFAAAHPSE